VSDRVQPQPIDLGRSLATGSAQHRTDPGSEFSQVEGLGEIVIAARGKARKPGREAITSGQEDDRHIQPGSAHGLTDVPAIGVRQPDVQHDCVDLVINRPQRACSVRGCQHLEMLLAQASGENVTKSVVVLYDQDAVNGHAVRLRTFP
jgi:hypothetical protein